MIEKNTYNSVGVLTRSEISKTANVKTVVNNTLTADGKSILTSVTGEEKNGVLQDSTQTNYTYYSDGTVASETVTANGQTITKTYTYNYRTDGGYTLTESVTSSDGANVTTVKEFDIYGHPSAMTDANGNRTAVACDFQGRQISQTNPDGTQSTTVYDTPNNTVTNANGDKQKSIYTALGSLKEVQVYNSADGKWKTLEQYTYDGKNRNTEKKVLTSPTAAERYTYDSLDRIKTRTLLENGAEKQKTTYTYQYSTFVQTHMRSDNNKTIDLSGKNYKKAMIIYKSNAGHIYSGFNEFSVSLDSKCIELDNLASGAVSTYVADLSGVQSLDASSTKSADFYIAFTTDDSANFAGANLTTTTTTTGDSYYTPPKTVTVSNAVGQTLSETSYAGNSSTVNNKSFYQYDYQGNVLQTKTGRVAMQSLASYSTKTEYNYLNLPVKEYVADGRTVTKTYDQFGRMLTQTDPMGNTTTYVMSVSSS